MTRTMRSIDEAGPQEWDAVNRPEHYNKGGIEAIDYIRQQLGDKFVAYCEGSVLKYIHRYKYKKKPVEDLRKARFYLDKLIDEEIEQEGQRGDR